VHSSTDVLPEPHRRPTAPARIVLALIRGYKVAVSPWFSGACRYTPGCADYTAEAIRRFGVTRGGWIGLRRIARCHPWGGFGIDPVPDHISR
jgi:hypothetical protein